MRGVPSLRSLRPPRSPRSPRSIRSLRSARSVALLALVALAAGVAVFALVCRGGGGMNVHSASGMSGVSGAVEDSIVSGLRTQLGVEVSGVRCADGRCAAVLVSGGELPIAIHGADWELGGLVIAAAPLEQYVTAALGDLGVTTRVDCGPRVRAVQVADRIECTLATGGRAFATIRDSTGAFAIEIALDREAAAARTTEADVAALDRMSAALDRGGDATGEGGDDGEPIDAGAAGVVDAGAP